MKFYNWSTPLPAPVHMRLIKNYTFIWKTYFNFDQAAKSHYKTDLY